MPPRSEPADIAAFGIEQGRWSGRVRERAAVVLAVLLELLDASVTVE